MTEVRGQRPEIRDQRSGVRCQNGKVSRMPEANFGATFLGWLSWQIYHSASRYGAMALTKLTPFGVPTPVTLSQPGPVVSDVSVPKVITNQRVENGLLYRAL